MAKRKNQFLINLHTSELNSIPTEARLGEIAVRHNESKPELIIKVGEETGNTFATFIDKNAVSGLLTTVNTDLTGRIDDLTENLSENYATSAATEAAINTVDGKFASYATSAATDTAIKAVDGKVDTLSNKLTTDYATSAATETAINAVINMIDNIVIDCGEF